MRLLQLSVPESQAELAADRLWGAGAGAVEELAGPDGTTLLRTVLAENDRVSLGRLGQLPDRWEVSFDELEDRPAQTWRQHAQPITVNDSLVLRPAWLSSQVDEAVVEIAIEPGASFGLGDHPTTRLSADATWRLATPGDRVLDVGCGSGVLSIIAAHRGAVEIVAIDIAEAARQATDENAARNGVGDRIVASTTPVGGIDGMFDLVLANILAPALVAMADDLRRLTSPDGALVLSGVLAGCHDHVLAALRPMRVIATFELDGWAAVELRHR
jgi:ribosomal protein L11 methyltransferase